MNVIDEIKARLDIVDVVGSYVNLKRSGKRYKALCPFHQEKTPSFVVFPETQTWHCFGACSTGGDIFTFIMKREGVDFQGALRLLAQRAGISLEAMQEEEEEQAELRKRLRDMHAAATAYFHENLTRRPEGEVARAYVKARGLNAETVAAFQLGYAADTWDGLLKYLKGLGYTEEEMARAGLIVIRDDGRAYDRFRHRLIIPLHDAQGRVIAFAGRVLDKGEPKYLNSPQTPIFDKGRTLYGYAQAIAAIREADKAIIVEGYMDVLRAHQAGFRNVVASMGTALTPTQLRLLARHTKHIVFALDPDAAGLHAVERGVEVARETLADQVEPMITPTGALRFQSTLDVDLRVLLLPEGKDPDDLIGEAPERWATLVEEALPVLDFYLHRISEDLPLDTPEGKREAVRVMAPLLREVSDATVRDHYLQRLARLLRVDERALAADIFRPEKRRRRSVSRTSEDVPRTSIPARGMTGRKLEAHIVALLLRTPEVLSTLGDSLQRLGQPDLRIEEFADARHRLIVQVLLTRLIGGNLISGEEILEDLPTEMHEYVRRLLAEAQATPEMPPTVARQAVIAAILRFRLQRHRESADHLRFLLEDAREEGDESLLLTYGIQLGNHLRAIRDLDRLLPAVMGR